MSDGGDKLNSKAIGEKLKRLRGDKSIATVAKSVGISTSALSMYENGERVPRDTIKIRLASYYEQSVQYIFFTE